MTVPFIERRSNQCCYIEDDDLTMCCGAPVFSGSYCAEHHSKCKYLYGPHGKTVRDERLLLSSSL